MKLTLINPFKGHFRCRLPLSRFLVPSTLTQRVQTTQAVVGLIAQPLASFLLQLQAGDQLSQGLVIHSRVPLIIRLARF